MTGPRSQDQTVTKLGLVPRCPDLLSMLLSLSYNPWVFMSQPEFWLGAPDTVPTSSAILVTQTKIIRAPACSHPSVSFTARELSSALLK